MNKPYKIRDGGILALIHDDRKKFFAVRLGTCSQGVIFDCRGKVLSSHVEERCYLPM